MASIVFTHIESVSKREGAKLWRVVTGAGIYAVEPEGVIARNVERPEYAGLVVLSVSRSGDSSTRIVGMATRDGEHRCDQIKY